MAEIHPQDCVCAFCRDRKTFAAPQHLLDAIAAGEVIVFAGAGISTENKTHARTTFYEEIRDDLKISENLSFPKLMDALCALPDGRIKLIEKIKKRFNYFISFDDFYRPMSQFHRSISPLYMITDIITTNWDDFFERECGFDAFTHDSDLAFWDAARRRVMKIHGSITNFGSIVATTNDYRQSFKHLNDGPLGAQLKSLIARKTVIYVGYSLSDENYLRLLRNIAKMMGANIRQSYLIAPNIDKKRLNSAPIPLIPIETDGAYFFEEVRAQLAVSSGIVRDEGFDACARLLFKIVDKHSKTAGAFIKTQHPLLISVLSYQDGLIHGLQRILRMKKTGEYHSVDHVHQQVHAYEHIIEDNKKLKDYWNAAYALGYQTALLFLILKAKDPKGPLPPLFAVPFNLSIKSLAAALRYPKGSLPKAVAAQANHYLKNHPKSARLIPDHTPYL
jgi:NAD-dependent SIR2 family protein deacetylase